MAPEVLASTESRPAVSAATHARRVRLTEARVVALACAVAYLGVAMWFWRAGLIPGDATSRVANAFYMVFSRDPHLAAVGFVWNPLPSLVLLPTLPLSTLFPALTEDGLIAGIASALCMAAVVAIANDTLRRLGVTMAPRLVLTLALAVHPMMLIYAGNGMSESLFLLCLIVTARSVQQWLAEGRADTLVVAGIGVGLAYATRYEAIAPVAAVPAMVFVTSWWRERGTALRVHTALTDAALVGLPGVASVGLWAVASKIIMNQWFATFSSEYGNAAQVTANAEGIASVTGSTAGERVLYTLQQLLGLQPLLPLVVLAAVTVAILRRDPRLLAPVAVFGSVLAFDTMAFLAGGSFGWLRFHITVIPLVVLLLGGALARPLPGHPALAGRRAFRRRRRAFPARSAAVVAALIIALAAVPASLWTLATPRLAREESEWLTTDGAARTADLTRLNHEVAADLDAMDLPDGAVVTDSAYAFAIILASDNPRQFVINSDRDFRAVLDDPAGHGALYLLVSTAGGADAVRLRHDALFGQTQPVREWVDRVGNVQWTLVSV